SVQNTTILEGVNQINTSVYSNLPENTYTLDGNLTKRFEDYQLRAKGNISLSDFSRIINEATNKYQTQHYQYELSGQTFFEEWPNFKIGFSQDFNTSKSKLFQNKFMALEPYFELDYDFWNGFIAKADYSYTYYKNKTNKAVNHFDV